MKPLIIKTAGYVPKKCCSFGVFLLTKFDLATRILNGKTIKVNNPVFKIVLTKNTNHAKMYENDKYFMNKKFYVELAANSNSTVI